MSRGGGVSGAPSAPYDGVGDTICDTGEGSFGGIIAMLGVVAFDVLGSRPFFLRYRQCHKTAMRASRIATPTVEAIMILEDVERPPDASF